METHANISPLTANNLNDTPATGPSCPRERSNTWPTTNIFFQQPADVVLSTDSLDDNCYLLLEKGTQQLDLIDESNENLLNLDQQQHKVPLSCKEIQIETTHPPPPRRPLSSSTNKSTGSHHHPSYVELITAAISSHPDRRMTLAEIYEWLSDNVPVFEQQRHMHSSSGWKNSVRHNLSLHNRFKRVKRNGMDKPSWWTLNDGSEQQDKSMEIERPVNHQPRSISARIAASGRRYSEASRRGSLSLASINRQKRRSTLPSIQPKAARTAVNSSPASWTSSASTVYSESSDSAFASSKSSLLLDQSSATLHKFVKSVTMTLQEHEKSQPRSQTPAVVLQHPQISLCVEMATPVSVNAASVPSAASMSDLLVQAANQFVLEAYLRPSSVHESSQILRVTTQSSGVRDVAVPAPIPIKVVVHCDKQSQTDWSTCQEEMASLPEDLATLNVEGDVDCNIMDILQFEMSCEDGKN